MFHVLTDQKHPDFPIDLKFKTCQHTIIGVNKYYPDLIHFANQILASYGYKCETITDDNYDKKCHVEYHVYHNNNPDTIVESSFGIHCDNRGGVNYDVHTCIIYFENTFESGGELWITDEKSKINKIKPIPDMIVLMDGSVAHEITPVKGCGTRRCVVIQIQQLNG